MSYEELEKSLYTTLKSKAEINDLCEKLQIRYEKLLLRSEDATASATMVIVPTPPIEI